MIFIRNLFKNDELFIHAANKYKINIIGNIIDNDENEIDRFKSSHPNIKLFLTKTAYQKNKSFWLSHLTNHIKVTLFRLLHLPNWEFRNSRYFKINFFSVFWGALIPPLRPYLRFQNKNWDKDLYLNKLIDSGFPVPKIYATLRDNEEPGQKLFNSVQFPCICKPSSCSGGYGVYLAKDSADILKLYSYEQNPDSQSDLALYYRNKTNRGIRNYIYNSHTLGGRYLFQEYIKGRTFSLSAALVNKKLVSPFCYEIHSADHQYFAEQGFSWPIDNQIESEILELATHMAQTLNYPEGPLMADFIYDEKGQIYIIDASPRASLTAAKLSKLVFQDNWHAECLMFAFINNELQSEPIRKGRPVFWQRLPLPKGQYESIDYPDFTCAEVVDYNITVQSGDKINEPRTDRQMLERGDFATTGNSTEEAQIKWNLLFKEIKWKLKT